MREVHKRQDETDVRVAENTDKIEEVRLATEELRRELREQARKTEGLQEKMEAVMDAELRERESRRLNLVIHGLQEPAATIARMAATTTEMVATDTAAPTEAAVTEAKDPVDG